MEPEGDKDVSVDPRKPLNEIENIMDTDLDSRKKPASSLDELVQKNIEAIKRIQDASQAARPRSVVVANAIAKFCGSVTFIYAHIAVLAIWAMWTLLPTYPSSLRLQATPFAITTLMVSMEAIFLSAFILISENQQLLTAEHRHQLDLQINMLAEQENSQVLRMLHQIMQHLQVPISEGDTTVLAEDTNAEVVADRLAGSFSEE